MCFCRCTIIYTLSNIITNRNNHFLQKIRQNPSIRQIKTDCRGRKRHGQNSPVTIKSIPLSPKNKGLYLSWGAGDRVLLPQESNAEKTLCHDKYNWTIMACPRDNRASGCRSSFRFFLKRRPVAIDCRDLRRVRVADPRTRINEIV